jgi:hypothetical protein
MIGITPTRINQWLVDIAAVAGRPWRAHEKTAAIAAWIALANSESGRNQ